MILQDYAVKGVRIIKTQKTLDKYVRLYPTHDIQTFASEEEAIKYI